MDESLRTAIANGRLEGLEPTQRGLELLQLEAEGMITHAELLARVAAGEVDQ